MVLSNKIYIYIYTILEVIEYRITNQHILNQSRLTNFNETLVKCNKYPKTMEFMDPSKAVATLWRTSKLDDMKLAYFQLNKL